MANADNLKPFNKGYDPRRGHKPKGTKHLSTHIQEMLHDKNFTMELEDGTIFRGAPLGAILTVMARKAIAGDIRASEWLAKNGYGTKVIVDSEEGIVRRGMSIEEINAILKRADDEAKRPPPKMTSHQLEQIAELRRHKEERENGLHSDGS